ncbi:MAG: serine/threonine-protein kinase [Myxococcota bacterium]
MTGQAGAGAFPSDEALPFVRADSLGRSIRFLDRLGSGAFGEVYKAQIESGHGLWPTVAVKLLKPEQRPESQSVERMWDEAASLASLQHPVILAMRELIEVDGRLGLVTEFVDGIDLSKALRPPSRSTPPIPLELLVHVVGQVADALHVVAQNELVHRDIKPSNIRIGVHGTVKLLDFGIARPKGGQRMAETRKGWVVGTPAYLAPERLRDMVGPECDVFALGLILFQAAAGRPLNEDFSEERWYRSLASQPLWEEVIREGLSDLPADKVRPELIELIEQATDFDPQRRPTALEVAQVCGADTAFHRWCRKTLKGVSHQTYWHPRRGELASHSSISKPPSTLPPTAPATPPTHAPVNSKTIPIRRELIAVAALALFVLFVGATLTVAGVAYWMWPPSSEPLLPPPTVAKEATLSIDAPPRIRAGQSFTVDVQGSLSPAEEELSLRILQGTEEVHAETVVVTPRASSLVSKRLTLSQPGSQALTVKLKTLDGKLLASQTHVVEVTAKPKVLLNNSTQRRSDPPPPVVPAPPATPQHTVTLRGNGIEWFKLATKNKSWPIQPGGSLSVPEGEYRIDVRFIDQPIQSFGPVRVEGDVSVQCDRDVGICEF